MCTKLGTLFAAASIIVILGTGCMSMSADLVELRQTIGAEQLSFVGAGAATGQQLSVAKAFALNISDDLSSQILYAEVAPLNAQPQAGVSNLTHVQLATLSLKGIEGLSDLELAKFDPADGASGDNGLVLKVQTNEDIGEYLRKGAQFELSMTHLALPQDWSITIELPLLMRVESNISL